MSDQHHRNSPIVEFLGADAGAGGPFALLGLGHEIVSDDQVIKACRRRLNQIERHPQRSTPNADEVRLALHTATSQLLNHDLREQLAKRWPPGVPVSLPKAWVPKQRSRQLKPTLISKARKLVGASGGWNSTARKRLAHFARINRVTALELVSALNVGSPSNSTENDQSPVRLQKSHIVPSFELIENAPSKISSWLPAYTILFLMSAALISTVLYVPQIQAPQDEIVKNRSAISDVPNTVSNFFSDPTVSRDEFGHYTALAHELDQIAAKAQTQPVESVERFKVIFPLFVERWILFPEPALSRSSLNISGFTRYVAQSDFDEDELVAIFAKTPMDTSSPQQIMIRAAILDVLLSEYRLPAQLRTKLSDARSACVPGLAHPSADVHTALGLIAGLQGVESTTDNSEWWDDWLEGVNAFTTEDKLIRTKLVLSVLSSRIRKADPLDSEWKETADLLASSLSWKSGSSESFWLVSQLTDESVNTPRLSALTESIATNSQAPMITIQMVLNPTATMPQRQQLANQFKDAWDQGKSESETPTQLSTLITELHYTVSLTSPNVVSNDIVDSYIKLARLNTAMWQYEQGRTSEVAELLATFEQRIPARDDPAVYSMDMHNRDTQWAESAINAETPAELRSMFAQLRTDNGGGVNSAHALVYLATVHANADMRIAARSQILRYRDRPSILIAVDYAATNNRVSSRLAQLVSDMLGIQLPNRTDDSWYPSAHQALLTRLSNALSLTMESDLNRIEYETRTIYLSRLIEQSYVGDPLPSAIDSARNLFRQSMREFVFANSNELQTRIIELEAMTLVRVERSKSPIQIFLAYQRSICAMKALHIEQRLPGRSLQVQDLLAQLETRLDQSNTVLNQIIQVEHCIAKLWLLSHQGGNS
ncbi:MAG: hypothetical protein P1U42_01785 [Phycisphaerales bacterium]|nr:hypothetical protein [Phycisphaerales bacterium]